MHLLLLEHNAHVGVLLLLPLFELDSISRCKVHERDVHLLLLLLSSNRGGGDVVVMSLILKGVEPSSVVCGDHVGEGMILVGEVDLVLLRRAGLHVGRGKHGGELIAVLGICHHLHLLAGCLLYGLALRHHKLVLRHGCTGVQLESISWVLGGSEVLMRGRTLLVLPLLGHTLRERATSS